MADGDHPSRATLHRFFDRKTAQPAEADELAELAEIAEIEELAQAAQPSEESYRDVVGRALAVCRNQFGGLQQARSAVRRRFRGGADGMDGTAFSGAAQPFQAWAWCELLGEAVETCRGAEGAVDIAYLAALAADRLTGPLAAAELADLRARAWAELGNLQRAADRLDLAEESLDRALDYLQAGSGDDLLLARVLDFHGSLYRDQRRFGEAVRAVDRAAYLFLENGEHQRAARALVAKGLTLIYAEQPEHALAALERAFACLDSAGDHHLVLAAVHNCLLALVADGQFERAARLLPSCRPLHAAVGSPLDHVRLLLLEGKAAAGLGQTADAERLFSASRAGFAAAEQAYDAALAALDLATLLLDQGRPAEVIHLVDEMLGSFHERGILREACASLLLLRQAIEQGQATAALVRTLTGQVKELQVAARAQASLA
jgi:tetratricopeptide (TPR) repeat protein